MYDETHKVLKDGRVVEKDPVIGKWSRRPAGIAKDLWERLLHLQKELQLLGPEPFTDKELRGCLIRRDYHPTPLSFPTTVVAMG